MLYFGGQIRKVALGLQNFSIWPENIKFARIKRFQKPRPHYALFRVEKEKFSTAVLGFWNFQYDFWGVVRMFIGDVEYSCQWGPSDSVKHV